MKNKFNLTREQNIFIAKRNIVDYIWKSANLEGIGVTYPETQAIYDGGVVNGLTVDNIIAINNHVGIISPHFPWLKQETISIFT